MADILRFRSRQQLANERARGRTLCRSGFHRWEVATDTRFDVRRGRLVTLERCARCGEERVTAE
jgi:hypothetical protein